MSFNPNDIPGIPTFAELTALNGSQYPGGIWLQGYYTVGDGGGERIFYWDSLSTTPPDGGTIVKPTGVSGTGRWIQTVQGNPVQVEWFGFIGDGSSHPLSSRFATLADAQALYPFVSSLTDEMDGVAIQASIYRVSPYITMPADEEGLLTDYGGEVILPVSKYLVNTTIYLNPHVVVKGIGGFQTYTGISDFSSITNPGMPCGCWTGPYTQQSIMYDVTGFYISTNPAYVGTATGGSTSAVTFNASSISGINSNTFLGSVLTITSGSGVNNSPRLITAGSYSAPNYTATVLDPFNNGTPDNTSVLSIPANTQGERYTAPEGPSGTNNFNSGGAFNITLTPGIGIENMTLFAGNGCAVGIRLNGAPNGRVNDITCIGFDTCQVFNSSYYTYIQNINNQYKYIGTAWTGDNWSVAVNHISIPLLSGGDVQRMSTTNRPWYIGLGASSDLHPYLNTANYAIGDNAGIYTVIGGNSEQGDRGWYAGCFNLCLLGHNVENLGLYSTIAGQVAYQVNGTKVYCGSPRFGQAANRNGSTLPYIPIFSGFTPYLTIDNFMPQVGQNVQVLGPLDFTFGGLVTLDNVTPGNLDTQPVAATPIIWNSYPVISTTLTPSGGWTAADTFTVSDQHGRIFLEGQLTGGTVTSGTTVGTVPAAYVPSQTVYATVGSGTGFATPVVVNIQTNGQIVLQSTLASALISLDGISWPSSSGY